MILGVPWYILVLPVWIVLTIFVIARIGLLVYIFLWAILRMIPIVRSFATFFLAVIAFPGVLVHEGCHWLMGRAAGAHTRQFTLYPRFEVTPNGIYWMGGSNEFDDFGDVVFWGLVLIAPLIIGNIALMLLLIYGFDIPASTLFAHPSQIIHTLPSALRSILAEPRPLLLFLLVSATAATVPSRSDWPEDWLGIVTMIVIAVFVGVFFFLGRSFLGESQLIDWSLRLLHLLALQLTLVLLAYLPVFLILLLPGIWAVKAVMRRESRIALHWLIIIWPALGIWYDRTKRPRAGSS